MTYSGKYRDTIIDSPLTGEKRNKTIEKLLLLWLRPKIFRKLNKCKKKMAILWKANKDLTSLLCEWRIRGRVRSGF